MSMILQLKRISDSDLAKVMATPETVRTFIDADKTEPDRGPEFAAAMAEVKMRMAAAGYSPPPPPPAAEFETYPFNDIFDVHKSWHGLYFLLTGSAFEGAHPASWLLTAPSIGDVDVGYGPARAISAAQTAQLSTWLDSQSRDRVVARFDAAKMDELDIYPSIWDEDPDELKDELCDAFDALKAYSAKCAAHGLGMLSYII